MKLKVKVASIAPGLTLEFAERGDEAGLPVLFLHGYADSWRSFERVLAHLPSSLRAIAISQRGHGNSDRPDAGYRSQDFAGDLAAFMDALGIARAFVVGHSMGTQVALRFATLNPERVSGLALIGAYDTLKENSAVQDLWDSAIVRFEDPIDPSLVRAFQESTLAAPVPPDFLDTIVAESLKVPARVWRAVCTGLLQDDLRAELGSITAPTFILWGDADGLCSHRQQDALGAAIKDSRLTIYPGGGHGLHWERPEQVANDLTAFIGTIASAVRGAPGRGSEAAA